MKKTHTVDDILLAAKPAEEVLALRAEVARLERLAKAYKREHGNIEALINAVVDAVPQCAPVAVKYKGEKHGAKTPVDVALHLSDIHYGAVQCSDEVEGFGSYSPEICRLRLHNLVADVLDWVAIKRNGYHVPRCHVLMTGDYVSGDIHDELRVTNAFPAPVQAVGVAEIMTECLMTLAAQFESVHVHIVTDDNHGRLTRKPQAKEGGLNNWGYVVARYMAAQVQRQANLKVNIISRPWDSVECNGRRYLLTHGHHVMGWAGFPYYGIERLVAREALKRMNAADVRKFSKVVMGHWHAPLAHPWYWIGGSVSGTDAFDHGQGRHSEAKQVSWMIHPEHGEFDRTEWLLRE